ncbi:MAG: type II CRISPR RNA-guided endonuclease Cas9 [Nitrospinae bacterium]|nr:type II CRISPR RNA-guided endonuclease Cas9 [Nitrospinota bacterium]
MKILGLDIGTNSIGWAVIERDDEKLDDVAGTGKILGAGARVFTAPVEDKTEAPKNQERRAKRGARKILARRKMRREHLTNILVSTEMLPSDKDEREKLLNTINPYKARAEGLDGKISLYELGRALFHMNKRRGFKSNRNADRKEKDKDKSKVLDAIKDLQGRIDHNARTLGEYLYKQNNSLLRKQYTHRNMYETEFEKLWATQAAFHPELTQELKIKINKAIFFQRPLKSQKGLVGFCELERKIWRKPDGGLIDKGPRRAAKSHPLAQRIRMLQDVTNLKVNAQSLKKDQLKTIIEAIDGKQKLTWAQVKKSAGIHKETKLNLEETGKKHIPGDYTSFNIAKALGAKWQALDVTQRESLYTDLTTIENEAALIKRLTEGWGFSKDESEALAKVELEDGYAAHSLKAIKKLLPHMEAGLTYPEAKIAAGYGGVSGASEGFNVLPEPPQVRNPVVQKALYETRKVVNAIIRKFGKPDIIRVELARDAKQPKKVKDERHKQMRDREAENETIDAELKNEFGVAKPTREDRDKYRLWLECNRTSPYSGKAIGKQELFTADVQVEHILPWQKSLDNSYMNKTLCFQKENLEKGDNTPFQAWSHDEQKWGEIEKRIESLPLAKRRRFYMTEIPDGFLDSQLTDTRYITKEVCAYLKSTGVRVDTNKGLFTAWLRGEWGLYDILPKRNYDLKAGKDRSDHRHHALDAIVIALTGPWQVHMFSRATSRGDGRLRYSNFPVPWKGFRDDAQAAIDAIIVSHRATRKIRGALHEETSYGATSEKGVFVRRKTIETMTYAEVKRIRDERIRDLILKRIEEHGGDCKAALKTEFVIGKHSVKKARLLYSINNAFPILDKKGKEYRFLEYGKNHHIEIIKPKSSGKWEGWEEGDIVTMMEAARRARPRKGEEKRPIINTICGPDNELVMSLSINEMLRMNVDGDVRIYRVQKLSKGYYVFREHCSAGTEDETKPAMLRIQSMGALMSYKPEKVTVSPIGEVFPAHD